MEKKQLIENRALELYPINDFAEFATNRNDFKAGALFALTLSPKWRKIDKDNLPDNEVIAINIKDDVLIGYIGVDSWGGFDCEDNHQSLENCTHYILLSELLNLEKEN